MEDWCKGRKCKRGSRQRETYHLIWSSWISTLASHRNTQSGEHTPGHKQGWTKIKYLVGTRLIFLPSKIRLHEEWCFELGLE